MTEYQKVTIDDPAESIAAAILRLCQKKKSELCRSCKKNDKFKACDDCLSAFHACRNSGIKILRNIFGFPADHDVPAGLFHLASKEAVNLVNDEITPTFIRGIAKLKRQFHKDKLIVPPNEPCPRCKNIQPPSRLGYVIYGYDPVCWDCELKRMEKPEKEV